MEFFVVAIRPVTVIIWHKYNVIYQFCRQLFETNCVFRHFRFTVVDKVMLL